jgi:Site-specific recombinase XerD
MSTLTVLKAYRKQYPSMNFIFKMFGKDEPVNHAIIRLRLKEGLEKAGLDTSLTTHSLRHSYATHLLDAGEDIQTVQQRLGLKSVTTTMVYLHLAKVEKRLCISLIDHILQ